ncbi:pyrroline-5-carboxylate reductase [Parablautia intestinalis]|uniref:Pyrroline-5-carboxylate reductase n=1 Tax=Parablautia intestinalis TaxID=2320100 RepID=A0A3A9AIG4_9FIRM|nr:pyrroline-5-carboxylate reductase [Parablautia intestinalis]RKI87181.1 pyrroline-5-carboxylate reductase [Parablautia intestinalis]
MKIGFIGLGNMAKAMISGMLAKGIARPEEIFGSARTKETGQYVKEKYGIQILEGNRQVAAQADIVILAVKPQVFGEVIPQIKGVVRDDALVMSIAAGRTIAQIEEAFGKKLKLVRCMPNTPAMVGEGCSGVCRNELVSDGEMAQCMELLRSFGMAEEVPERLMNAVVGVSGSSPAFVFLFLEALADGAVKAGMPRGQAYHFATQTVLGSAKLLLETGRHPGELKDMVCSPGGTTIEGVEILEKKGLRSAVMEAVDACVKKAESM